MAAARIATDRTTATAILAVDAPRPDCELGKWPGLLAALVGAGRAQPVVEVAE